MDRKSAKELVHIRGWLDRVQEIVERGQHAYLADAPLQEAGDSLMMKLGEERTGCRGLACLPPMGSSGRSASLLLLFQAADVAIEADSDDDVGPR